MDNPDYVPRFLFEISPELRVRVDKYLSAHGVKKAVMTPILEDLLDLIEQHGNIIIGAILDETVRPKQIIPCMKNAERRVNDG